MLKHQLILHQDVVAPFAAERSITPYARREGFSWHLCPAKVGHEHVWLLINGELGYISLIVADPVTADAIDHAAVETIEFLLPDDREDDNVSVSLDPADVSWHKSDRMPVHVGVRYDEALQLLARQRDLGHAEDALDDLNREQLLVNGRTFAPEVGLEGLLEELADNFRHYMETTPWWKLWWHVWTKKTPWLDEDFGAMNRWRRPPP